MSSSALQIALICVLVLLNGVLALAEFAMASSRKARLQQRIDDGDRLAPAALKLLENPLDFLSTVQAGITVIGSCRCP